MKNKKFWLFYICIALILIVNLSLCGCAAEGESALCEKTEYEEDIVSLDAEIVFSDAESVNLDAESTTSDAETTGSTEETTTSDAETTGSTEETTTSDSEMIGSTEETTTSGAETTGSPEETTLPNEEPVPFDDETPTDSKCDRLLLIICIALTVVLIAVIGICIFLLKGKGIFSKGENNSLKNCIKRVCIGKVHDQGARSNQEDCFSVSSLEYLHKQGVLAVVSDGMGGLEEGEAVSLAAVSAVMSAFPTLHGSPRHIMTKLASCARESVNQYLTPDNLQKSGCTLVMGLVKDGYFHFISIGDSRICLYRNGGLCQLNRAHIFLNDLLIKDVNGEMLTEEIYAQKKLGGLTSYLGMGELSDVDIPVTPIRICKGDKFILMSDGVYNALTESELSAALSHGATDAAEIIHRRINAKNLQNQDNYTAVILECR